MITEGGQEPFPLWKEYSPFFSDYGDSSATFEELLDANRDWSAGLLPIAQEFCAFNRFVVTGLHDECLRAAIHAPGIPDAFRRLLHCSYEQTRLDSCCFATMFTSLSVPGSAHRDRRMFPLGRHLGRDCLLADDGSPCLTAATRRFSRLSKCRDISLLFALISSMPMDI
ncbi:hypothetical protein BDV09DRAFT_40145 [Aspergillus tetrazonus]